MESGDPYYEGLRNKFFDRYCPYYKEEETKNCYHCRFVTMTFLECGHPEHPRNKKIEDCIVDEL